jgi:hypothetical protein
MAWRRAATLARVAFACWNFNTPQGPRLPTSHRRNMSSLSTYFVSLHTALEDQARDIVRSAADAVLETLKSDPLKDFDKKKRVCIFFLASTRSY